MNPHTPTHKAFTLIELLVTIAIIGVLIAISIPVVGKVRLAAREAKASSNIRQVGLALITTAAEHKGVVPGMAEALALTPPESNWWTLLEKNMSGRDWRQSTGMHLDPTNNRPDLTANSQWSPNPYVMPESSMLQALGEKRLSLRNANVSRVMLLTTAVSADGFNGPGQTAFALFWGVIDKFTDSNNLNRPIPMTDWGQDAPGGIGYNLGGENRSAALFAFLDGHVGKITKGKVLYGQVYYRN